MRIISQKYLDTFDVSQPNTENHIESVLMFKIVVLKLNLIFEK